LSELLQATEVAVNYYTDYGVVEALDGCSLSIEEGNVVALTGESGCGKSTIAKAILRVVPSPPGQIVSGSIMLQGQDLLQMEENRLNSEIRGKKITLIPQDPFSSFNPVFTLGTQIIDIMKWKAPSSAQPNTVQNRRQLIHRLRFSGREKRKTDRKKVIDLLRQLEIPSPEQQLQKYPHELSGGQRQRIMIAMALLPGPLLIIADEPTTSLDVTIEAQLLQMMNQLVKESRASVLFITHDLGVASQISDRIVIMYAGQEMESAETSRFFLNAFHPYTLKLLASLPKQKGIINDIPGEVPSLINPLPGCRFFDRCSFRTSKCKEVRPPVQKLAPNHWVRCFHPQVHKIGIDQRNKADVRK